MSAVRSYARRNITNGIQHVQTKGARGEGDPLHLRRAHLGRSRCLAKMRVTVASCLFVRCPFFSSLSCCPGQRLLMSYIQHFP